jgi:hypothetical protein
MQDFQIGRHEFLRNATARMKCSGRYDGVAAAPTADMVIKKVCIVGMSEAANGIHLSSF